jgi:hypothetical protein
MEIGLNNVLINKYKERSDSKSVLYSSIALFALFSLTVYMVYFAPIGIDKLFCAILLVLFWYSKTDYFWFAFFMIISSFPAGLFSDSSYDAVRRLPIYSPISKISFSLLDLFLIISFFKAAIKGKSVKLLDVFKIKKIVYIIPYVVITSLFFGVTFKVFLNHTLRGLFFYTIFYSFPALIYTKKDIYKFMTMFFPFVFLEILAQIYTISTGNLFTNLFYGSSIIVHNSITGDIRALPYGFLIMRIAFSFAFVFLDNEERIVPKYYALLVILTSILSVIIAATRTPIIIFILTFIIYFVFIAKKKPNIIIQVFILIVIVVSLLDFVKVFNLGDIINSSFKRLIGAVSIEQGTMKVEDTFDNRLNVRLPILLNAVKNSFLIGYGLSDKYFEYYDGHIGGVLIGFLQVGIFGYTMYLVFIYNIFKKCFYYIRKLAGNNSSLIIIKVFTLNFLAYLFLNFTVEPIFVLNTSTAPQEIFILLVVATLFINFAIKEQKLYMMEKQLYNSE